MQRRRALSLIGSGCVLGVAGCLGLSESDPGGQDTPSPVREWARDAESKDPVRVTGEAVRLERTITDEPGYEQDNFEYFPQNRTYRYVKARSSRETVAYDTWSFEKWGRLKSATKGAIHAGTVTVERLGVEDIASGISSV